MSNDADLHALVHEYQYDTNNMALQQAILDALYPLICTLTSSVYHTDKELLISDIHYQILTSTKNYKPNKAKYTSWVYSIIKRTVYKFLHQPKSLSMQPLNDNTASKQAQPLDAIVTHETVIKEFQLLYNTLTDKRHRKIIELFMRGLSHKRVAKRLRIKPKTLSNHLLVIRKIARSL